MQIRGLLRAECMTCIQCRPHWIKNLIKVSQVIDVGVERKERLSQALNKMFAADYDKRFVGGIKEEAMNSYTANAQQIIQNILLDVDWKQAAQLRSDAVEALKHLAKEIFLGVQHKYQHDLPLFKALVKGEFLLNTKTLK